MKKAYFIKNPGKKLANILTNHIFKFLFLECDDNIKSGDIIKIENNLFEFDDYNGNINSLKNFYANVNGFWNYIKAKEGSIFDTETGKCLNDKDTNSQGYLGLEYYKNGFDKATEEEIKIYRSNKKI